MRPQLKSVDENYGTVVLDGEVRRGYRIKVMVSGGIAMHAKPSEQYKQICFQLLAHTGVG